MTCHPQKFPQSRGNGYQPVIVVQSAKYRACGHGLTFSEPVTVRGLYCRQRPRWTWDPRTERHVGPCRVVVDRPLCYYTT